MRQHLDTAPVWEAYRTQAECPLCLIQAQCERSYVENFLGGSVMEPAMRVEVNDKGFCARHFAQLYDAGNRLGLALMADTYLKQTISCLERDAARARPKPGLFARGGAQPSEAARCASTCILCDRLNDTMERYAATLCDMWNREQAFKTAFAASKGLCLTHYALVSAIAPEEMPAAAKAFLPVLSHVTLEGLRRVERDLEGFTLKFDYRNRDKPWGESRDAVERALNKLRGACVGACAHEMKPSND